MFMTSLQNKKQYIVIIIPFRWRMLFDLHQIIAEHRQKFLIYMMFI